MENNLWWVSEDIGKFSYLDLGKNWKGQIGNNYYFSEWKQQYCVGEREMHSRFFFLRRECKPLIKICVFKINGHFNIGFYQEGGGSGLVSENKYFDLDIAKTQAMIFFGKELVEISRSFYDKKETSNTFWDIY